jgi:aspartate carbamoyltransferase catalytic subunit
MPHSSALIEIENLPIAQIESLFHSALDFSKKSSRKKDLAPSEPAFQAPQNLQNQTVALLFFEPSTRTRFSFETAAARLGLHPLLLDAAIGTSLEKGESIEDTILNIAAMEPEALIIRCDDQVDLYALQKKVSMPILNAGWGKRAHPSQALLDALTLQANGRKFSEEKLLVIGDVKHSRVTGSHFQLAKILGYEIAICGPKEFLPENYPGRYFESLSEGMEWATVLMALRMQHERHGKAYALTSYRENYGIDLKKLKTFKADGLLLHPGPVHYGVELELDVNEDPRCKILEQVKWGTYLRQALLARRLSEKAVS